MTARTVTSSFLAPVAHFELFSHPLPGLLEDLPLRRRGNRWVAVEGRLDEHVGEHELRALGTDHDEAPRVHNLEPLLAPRR